MTKYLLHYEIIKPKEKYDSNVFIIFLHGFMFSDIWHRTNFVNYFNKYQCVLIDVLGFGNSPKPHDIDYSIRDHVDYVNNTIKYIIKDQTHPVIYGIGYSTGAIILVNLMAEHTLPWCKCILISPAFFVKTANINKELNVFYKMSSNEGFDDFFNIGKLFVSIINNNISKDVLNNRYVRELKRNDPIPTRKTFFNLLFDPDWDIDTVLSKINKKILCIHPIHDEFITIDFMKTIYNKYKHIFTLIEWDNNHFINHKNVDYLAKEIFNFF